MSKQPIVCGVYRILHVASNRQYIGSAIDIRSRWSVHKWALCRRKHHCHHLQRVWSKYGARSFRFEIVETCAKEEMRRVEQHYIDTTPTELLLNIHPVATHGGCLGFKHSDTTRAKMSKSAKRASNTPGQKAMRSERAKRQHRERNLGRCTWLENRIEDIPILPDHEWCPHGLFDD